MLVNLTPPCIICIVCTAWVFCKLYKKSALKPRNCMLVTVEWCTRGVDVGSTLNWNANTRQCICTHGVFTYTQCIYSIGGRDIHIFRALF